MKSIEEMVQNYEINPINTNSPPKNVSGLSKKRLTTS